MSHFGSKTGSLDKVLEKPCVLMKFQMSSKIGHIGLKTWSLGQILEKPCVCSRGHIFSPIIMKFGQNICIDKISNEYENRLCQVKN